MRISDRELKKACTYAERAYLDLEEIRKLARAIVEVWDDPNCTRDGSVMYAAIVNLKTHLEGE